MLNFELGRTVSAIGNLSDGSDMSYGSDRSDRSDRSDESDGSGALGVEVGGEWISSAYDMTLWCKYGYNGVTICIY